MRMLKSLEEQVRLFAVAAGSMLFATAIAQWALGTGSPFIYAGSILGLVIGVLVYFKSFQDDNRQLAKKLAKAPKRLRLPVSAEAEEHRQVAALVCLDIDILGEVAKRKDLTADELRAQIQFTLEKKNKLILDPQERQQRYDGACLLFTAVASGQVHCTKIK